MGRARRPAAPPRLIARTSAVVTRARETGSTAAAEFRELFWNIESISAPAREARSVAERWASERVRDCVSCKSMASQVTPRTQDESHGDADDVSHPTRPHAASIGGSSLRL